MSAKISPYQAGALSEEERAQVKQQSAAEGLDAHQQIGHLRRIAQITNALEAVCCESHEKEMRLERTRIMQLFTNDYAQQSARRGRYGKIVNRCGRRGDLVTLHLHTCGVDGNLTTTLETLFGGFWIEAQPRGRGDTSLIRRGA